MVNYELYTYDVVTMHRKKRIEVTKIIRKKMPPPPVTVKTNSVNSIRNLQEERSRERSILISNHHSFKIAKIKCGSERVRRVREHQESQAI